MASTTSTKIHWAEKIDFDRDQATLAVDTGDFTYFHVSRAQYYANDVDYAALLDAQAVGLPAAPAADVDTATKQKLKQILIGGADNVNKSVGEMKKRLLNTNVDTKAPKPDQEKVWAKAIDEQNELFEKHCNARLDAIATEAKSVIRKMPFEELQKPASALYTGGFNIFMQLNDFALQKIKDAYTVVKQFVQEIIASIVSFFHRRIRRPSLLQETAQA